MQYRPLGLRRKRYPVTLDCGGMGSIPAMHEALNVPLLLCHKRFNEATTSSQLAYQSAIHNKNVQYAKYAPPF